MSLRCSSTVNSKRSFSRQHVFERAQGLTIFGVLIANLHDVHELQNKTASENRESLEATANAVDSFRYDPYHVNFIINEGKFQITEALSCGTKMRTNPEESQARKKTKLRLLSKKVLKSLTFQKIKDLGNGLIKLSSPNLLRANKGKESTNPIASTSKAHVAQTDSQSVPTTSTANKQKIGRKALFKRRLKKMMTKQQRVGTNSNNTTKDPVLVNQPSFVIPDNGSLRTSETEKQEQEAVERYVLNFETQDINEASHVVTTKALGSNQICFVLTDRNTGNAIMQSGSFTPESTCPSSLKIPLTTFKYSCISGLLRRSRRLPKLYSNSFSFRDAIRTLCKKSASHVIIPEQYQWERRANYETEKVEDANYIINAETVGSTKICFQIVNKNTSKVVFESEPFISKKNDLGRFSLELDQFKSFCIAKLLKRTKPLKTNAVLRKKDIFSNKYNIIFSESDSDKECYIRGDTIYWNFRSKSSCPLSWHEKMINIAKELRQHVNRAQCAGPEFQFFRPSLHLLDKTTLRSLLNKRVHPNIAEELIERFLLILEQDNKYGSTDIVHKSGVVLRFTAGED